MSENDIFDKEEENEFGPFGTGVKPVRFGFLFRHSHIVTFFILLCAVPLILSGWYYLYWHFLESESPMIEVAKLPAGLGGEGNEITFRVRDRGTGLKWYEVRLTQGERSVTLERRELTGGPEEQLISIFVRAKDHRIGEGEASILVSAQDRAMQPNTSTLPVILKVDYQSPSIEYLVGGTQFSQGGTGLVCYQVSEKDDILSGVTLGANIFPGLPAKGLHPDFTPFARVFCAFFPIPIDLPPAPKLRLFIRDPVGNTAGVDLALKIQTVAPAPIPLVISKQKAEQIESELKKKLEPDHFRAVENEIQPLFTRPKGQAFWTNEFRRASGEQLWKLGDSLEISVDGEQLSVLAQEGYFRLAARAPVRANADGIVIFSGPLGVYGTSVIVDHGFGISTIYSHLLSGMKREGDRIFQGDPLGAAGQSGVSSEDGYGYSVRVHGIPVRRGDWDDGSNYATFFIERLRELRKKLGIKEVRVLN